MTTCQENLHGTSNAPPDSLRHEYAPRLPSFVQPITHLSGKAAECQREEAAQVVAPGMLNLVQWPTATACSTDAFAVASLAKCAGWL